MGHATSSFPIFVFFFCPSHVSARDRDCMRLCWLLLLLVLVAAALGAAEVWMPREAAPTQESPNSQFAFEFCGSDPGQAWVSRHGLESLARRGLLLVVLRVCACEGDVC